MVDNNRDAKVETAREALRAGLAALTTGEDWAKMLQGIASNARQRLSPMRYSFSNQMVVASSAFARQVDGTAVGTYNAWAKVGRTVKRGERAVYILAPRPFVREVTNSSGTSEEKRGMFFRAMPVFLLGQTEGEELPAAPALPKPVANDDVPGFDEHLTKLRDVALAIAGEPVSSFEIRERESGDPLGALGWYSPRDRSIVVIDTGNRTEMFKVAVHEVAHSLMHATVHHSYAWQEVEAESVAFVVANVFGLDTSGSSFPYVASWATSDKTERDALKIVNKSGDRIVRAVNTILDALLGKVVHEEA
jgi:antirestriction protein ArdC